MSLPDGHHNVALTELERPPSPFLNPAISAVARYGDSISHTSSSIHGSKQNANHVAINAESSSISAPIVEPSTISRKQRVLCPYWYHYGSCRKADEQCKYAHALHPNFTQSVAYMPGPIKGKKHSCGLPLCRIGKARPCKQNLTDASVNTNNMHATLPRPVPAWAVPPREEQSALITTTPTSSSVQLLQPLASKTSRAARAQRANDHPNRANNNKRTARHWDAPPSPTKRIKLIDYDDLESSRSSPPLPEQSSKFVEFDDLAIRTGGVGNDDSEVTCFFWYHGTCSRSMDEKNGFKCHFKHGLTEPPSSKCRPTFSTRSMYL